MWLRCCHNVTIPINSAKIRLFSDIAKILAHYLRKIMPQQYSIRQDCCDLSNFRGSPS